jgi:hypothetical protein
MTISARQHRTARVFYYEIAESEFACDDGFAKHDIIMRQPLKQWQLGETS